MAIVVGCLAAFLLGAIPFALVLVRLLAGVDLRRVGSGNPGATNASRVFGPRKGLLVFLVVYLLDAAKGFVPAWFGPALAGDSPFTAVLLGLSAILDFDEDGYPEIFLPSARRRSLRVLRYKDGEIKLIGRDFYDAQIIGDFRLEDLDGNGMDEVIFHLDDGLEVRLYR